MHGFVCVDNAVKIEGAGKHDDEGGKRDEEQGVDSEVDE